MSCRHLFFATILGVSLVTITSGLTLTVDPAQSQSQTTFTSVSAALASVSQTLAKSTDSEPLVIFLAPGCVITESIQLSPQTTNPSRPIIITSDPANPSTIVQNTGLGKGSAVAAPAVNIYNRGNVTVENQIISSSSLSGNGINLYADNGHYSSVTIRNCTVSGFAQGIIIGGWEGSTQGFSDVLIENCVSHGNLLSGIFSYCQPPYTANDNITVRYCQTYDNPGDPNKTDGHSGNGIVLSGLQNSLIEYCTAYNNGKQCKTVGGPVGIWCYQATNVVIQYCESYDNGTNSSADGGGFDIDGGAQNCIIQYCYSHDNDGPGYLWAQYADARAMTNNTIRYNVSQNDGQKNSYGGICLWSSGSSGGIVGGEIYGNTVFAGATSGAAFEQMSGGMSNISVRNNIFLAAGGAPVWKGGTSGLTLSGNCYFGGTYSVTDNNKIAANPMLNAPGSAGIVGVDNLTSLSAYELKAGSPCIDAGVTIANAGSQDFFGNQIPNGPFDIGAHERPGAVNAHLQKPAQTAQIAIAGERFDPLGRKIPLSSLRRASRIRRTYP